MPGWSTTDTGHGLLRAGFDESVKQCRHLQRELEAGFCSSRDGNLKRRIA